MSSIEDVMKKLKARARPDQLDGMARYGIAIKNRLGVSMPELRKIAEEVGTDHDLALALWKSGMPEARIISSIIDDPARLTERQMELWVKDFDSWDVCDQVCMNLFEKSPLAWKKMRDWSQRGEEFVKRAAFALMSCVAWHDKKSDDKNFIQLLPLIESAASDERNYVKKAVNWALRNIGKRNPALNRAAIRTAKEIKSQSSRAAKWIASDALRELQSEAVQRRLGK